MLNKGEENLLNVAHIKPCSLEKSIKNEHRKQMTVYTQVTRIKWTLYDHFLELAKLLFSYEAILLVPHIQWLQKKWKTQPISTKHDLNQPDNLQ